VINSRTNHYTINSQSFRNEVEIPSEKTRNEYRILCIGDSSTFGSNVDQNQSYPAQLEKILNQCNNNRIYRVINAGCEGYTSFQVMRLLECKGSFIKPDFVVITCGLNDSIDRIESDLMSDFRNGPFPFIRRAIFNTNSYFVLSFLISKLQIQNEPQKRPVPRVSLCEFKANIYKIIQLASQLRANLILCPISARQKYRDAMIKIATTENIPFVDSEISLWRVYKMVENGLKEYGGWSVGNVWDFNVEDVYMTLGHKNSEGFIMHFNSRVMDDPGHPNPIGYCAIAEDLAKVIP